MLSNESESNRKENLADLRQARSNLLHRTDGVCSAFESSLNLLNAALNLIVSDEITDEDGAAIAEVLMITKDVIRAGYAQYRLEEKVVGRVRNAEGGGVGGA